MRKSSLLWKVCNRWAADRAIGKSAASAGAVSAGAARRQQRRQAMEQLERRVFLSASLQNGALVVDGTPAGDTISLTQTPAAGQTPAQIVVILNGVKSTYAAADVQSIAVHGLAGADAITIDNSIDHINAPVVVNGGPGRDTISGGAANDTLIGGRGADFITGGAGHELLLGGQGADRIVAGAGEDTIFGGLGPDAITAPASDPVDGGPGANRINNGKQFYHGPLGIHGAGTGKHDLFLGVASGYSPQQMRTAYEFNTILSADQGQGQTIVIVDAFGSPTITNDLAVFSQQFSLPMPTNDNFKVVNVGGNAQGVDGGWAAETSLDVEWAHALAPLAKIVLVAARSDLGLDLQQAVQQAGQIASDAGGGVVSMSFGNDEGADPNFQAQMDATFHSFPSVSFLAASGDTAGQLSYPATSPYATAVGGTFLPLDIQGDRIGNEVAWSSGGGGQSNVYRAPSYQTDLGLGLVGRGSPDVAMNADPASGVAIFDSTPVQGESGWMPGGIGGTSAATPEWAAVVALINANRAAVGVGTVGAKLNQDLYALAGTNGGQDFNDIIDGAQVSTGGGTLNQAFPGYDLTTGLGTPRVTNLVSDTRTDASFIQTNFSWTGQFLNSFNDSFDRNLPEYMGGSGSLSGGSGIDTTFTSVNQPFQPFFNVPQTNGTTLSFANFHSFDTFTGLDGVSPIRLTRATDNTVYGKGLATIFAIDKTITFMIELTGSISKDSSGVEHLSGEFHAINHLTGESIPTSGLARQNDDDPLYLGTTIEGSFGG